jgi:hypothetical protein
MVADVMDDDQVVLHLYNIYHKVPKRGHGLHALLNHNLDDLTPTAVLGDFNTHSPCWSRVGQTPSSWARDFTEWLDAQGLTCINPRNTPTWYDPSSCNASPTIIDLAFVIEAASFSGQIGDLLVSEGPIPLSDHASLTLTFYPITSLYLLPPLAPVGYNADPKLKDDWQKTFKQLVDAHQSTNDDLDTLITDFNTHIQAACKATLKLQRNPHPKGARWWTDECTRLHTAARAAPPGPERKAATRALKNGISQAKRTWAHDKLHQAVDAQDIWALAKVRKGRATNAFPPLRDTDNTLVDNPTHKTQIFQQCFFPEAPQIVQPTQEDDPPPLPTRTWTPITQLEITTALSTASDSSAPGPSGVGYRILKWAHSACPDVLTRIYNWSIDTGVHP